MKIQATRIDVIRAQEAKRATRRNMILGALVFVSAAFTIAYAVLGVAV